MAGAAAASARCASATRARANRGRGSRYGTGQQRAASQVRSAPRSRPGYRLAPGSSQPGSPGPGLLRSMHSHCEAPGKPAAPGAFAPAPGGPHLVARRAQPLRGVQREGVLRRIGQRRHQARVRAEVPGRPLAQPACQSVWLMSLAYALGAARLQPAPGSLRTRPCWHCTSRAQSWLRTTSNRVQCLSPALPLCSVWSCAALSSHSTSVVAHMPVGFCDRLPGSAAVLDAAMNNWTLRRAASARTCFHLGSARCLPVRCRRPESRQRRAAPGRPRTPTCSCARARCASRCASCTTRPFSARWARAACSCTATARRAQTPWQRPMEMACAPFATTHWCTTTPARP